MNAWERAAKWTIRIVVGSVGLAIYAHHYGDSWQDAWPWKIGGLMATMIGFRLWMDDQLSDD